MEIINKWRNRSVSIKQACIISTATYLALGLLLFFFGVTLFQTFQNYLTIGGSIGNATLWIMNHNGLILLGIATLIGVTVGNGYTIYRWKLKRPIEAFPYIEKQLEEDVLQITVPTLSDDEFGKLYKRVEELILHLKKTRKDLWKSVEERRHLNSSFAHEIRTPLSIIQGYVDMIEEVLNEERDGVISPENSSQEETLRLISIIQGELKRIHSYLIKRTNMRTLQEVVPEFSPIPFEDLCKDIQDTTKIMWNRELIFTIIPPESYKPTIIHVDKTMLLEVVQNIMANAIRYADKAISIRCEIAEKQLLITIKDDGPGFSDQALLQAQEPYYRDAPDNNENFGLGLYIAKTLCMKCGGKILISSPQTGGAIVTATFQQ